MTDYTWIFRDYKPRSYDGQDALLHAAEYQFLRDEWERNPSDELLTASRDVFGIDPKILFRCDTVERRFRTAKKTLSKRRLICSGEKEE